MLVYVQRTERAVLPTPILFHNDTQTCTTALSTNQGRQEVLPGADSIDAEDSTGTIPRRAVERHTNATVFHSTTSITHLITQKDILLLSQCKLLPSPDKIELGNLSQGMP